MCLPSFDIPFCTCVPLAGQGYVRRFPDTGRRWQVSVDGGSGPKWGRDGTRLYFEHQGTLFESRLQPGDDLDAGPPRPLMDLSRISAPATSYDELPDGSFVLIQPASWERESRSIEIVVRWPAHS